MSENKQRYKNVLVDKILSVEPAVKAKVTSRLHQEDSVLALQRNTPAQLMSGYPDLHYKEANRFKDRLDVASAALMRKFREKRLSTLTRRAADEMKGPLSLTNGPTFENQFLPDWSNNTQPDAIDATTSPAAYLIDLLMFAEQHIESQADSNKAVTLKTRRPDIYELLLDEKAMSRTLPQVDVINHVMEKAIDGQHSGSSQAQVPVEDKLLQVRYPLKHFPYETYWQQITTVLAHNQLLCSDVSRLSDVNGPYFIQPGAHSAWSDVALQQDSQLGPALRAILVEPPYFNRGSGLRFNPQTRQLLSLPAEKADTNAAQNTASVTFFKDNFGVSGYPSMQNVVNFCQALQISQDEMEALFGLGRHAPVLSDNAGDIGLATPVSAKLAAARFINDGPLDAVKVHSDADDPKMHQFQHLTQDRCDRLNRLVRLAHALRLTFAQTDQIVCAAIEAEQRSGTAYGAADGKNSLWMTVNTIRALGLFQDLRERAGCQAEEFAALMSHISVFGSGDALSHFDRVFNADTATPLVLDNKEFSISGDDAESKRTIDMLCSGLGINMETFRYLSRMIMQGQNSEKLRRSLPVISAFYRVTLLARLLSITTIELLSLLEVLSPEGQYALQLAGTPQNAMYQNFVQSDIVSVIHAISGCVRWCQSQEISISWLVQQLLPVELSDVVPKEIGTLFIELQNHVIPFLDFNRHLSEAGVTPLRSGDWQKYLDQIVDKWGLITDTGNTEEDFDPLQYEDFAEREIKVVIDKLSAQQEGQQSELPMLTSDEAERLKKLILGVVLRIRSQQWGVVEQRLSHFLSLNAERVIPVVYWAKGKVHQLLETAIIFDPEQLQSDSMKAIMPLIQYMKRCAHIAEQLSLSPMLFSGLLSRTQQARFSVRSTDLTLHTLYLLARYTYCCQLARQSEEQLLGYFSLIEALGDLSEREKPMIKDAAAEKIANWLGWGIREVLDVAARVSTDGIIRNLAQLCVLVETRQLSNKTGLSADSLMKLSRLSAHDDTAAYRQAAEEMLSSLRRQEEQRSDVAELRQSLSSRCMVSHSRLVAQKEGEEATITLKLLDMNNNPVSGIRVTWSTDMGTLLDRYSFTDADGMAMVHLAAGAQMGVAHVQGTWLLDSHAYAPPITIDCDEENLNMMPIDDRPAYPWELAGNKGTYTLRAQLLDVHNNPGVDRLVNWSTTIGSFVDSAGETLTDSEGFSTIKLRSRHPGEGYVAVSYAGSSADPQLIDLKFIDLPYIDKLELLTWTVVGDTIMVRARVLGLDDEPVAGRALSWECEGASLDKSATEMQTDENGEARAVLNATVAGTVKVTVLLNTDDENPLTYHRKELIFEVLADAQLKHIWESKKWPMADGVSASEYEVHIFSTDNKPVASYPVTWQVKETADAEPVTKLTGPDGIARYQLKSEVAGERTVSASWGADQTHTFTPVTFLPPLGTEILLDGQLLNGPVILTQQNPDEHVARRLTWRLAEEHPLLEKRMHLLYYGRDSALSLGLTFTPGLGDENSFDPETREVSWTINCHTTGLRHDAAIRLGFTWPEAMTPIWTDGIVKPLE